nr:uncharacterized protein LOC122321147 [Drosophila bipectinata]
MLVDFSVEVQNVCATMKASKLDQYLNNPALTQELVSKLPSMVECTRFWGMHKASLTVCTLAEFKPCGSIPRNDDPRSLECYSTVWLVLEMFPEPQGRKMRRPKSLRNRWMPRTPSSPVASRLHGSRPGAMHTDKKPRLLIGLNNCKLGRVLRTKKGTTEEPIAEKTRLGWTIKGRSSNSVGDDITPNYHVFHIFACEADENMEILRQLAIQQLEKNTRRINGRFEAGLLWRFKDDKLPDSLPTALKRARCLYQELTHEPELAKEIRRQLDEYVKKGYARPITSEEAEEKPWYLPIFPVLNVNKPGKLRIVWDAAAKTEGISLKTMLLKGPDQLAQLVPILHRFREKRIAIGGDIAEIFHQVTIHTKDQRYQRFVFIDPYTQRRENYAMQVMPFGASCSPSCAQYVKNRNAESFKKEYPRAVKCILENHYVDDMLDSVDTEEEAISLARQVHYIHLQGGFLIRNWVSNSREV